MTRELRWDGCLNVRDLGGVPLEQGGETRFGSLVRSDNVRRLTDRGWRALAEHGVVRIVDLRWREELEDDPPRDVDVDVVHVSLLGELDPDYTDDIEDYIAAGDPAGYWATQYTLILEEFAPNFAAALAAIADAPEGPVVFHCAGGKDRTGLVAALLLRLAGAAPDDRERRKRTFMQHSPPDAMRRALEELERRHGDVAAYLRAAGLDDERL